MPQSKKELREAVYSHFEDIAPRYDQYKKRSVYYYTQLKELLKELVADYSKKRIIEIGCGTGQLLLDLAPERGMGVDISPKMIELARHASMQNPSLQFEVDEAETIKFQERWDVIIMSDVIEHLYDTETAIQNLSSQMSTGHIMVITWANSLWEPILHLLEALKMKMPEGAHNWDNRTTVARYLQHAQLTIVTQGTRCIVPANIPGANWMNSVFYRVPGLKNLGLIRYIVARR